MSGHTGLLRGLPALLRTRLRLCLGVVSGLGLVAGLLLGWGMAMNDASPRESFEAFVAGAVVAALLGPFLASAQVTWGTQAGARREELLALPMGRLVLPAHVLLLGLGGMLAGSLAWALGLSLPLGPGRLLAGADAERVAVALLFGGGLFAWMTCACSLAAHPTTLALLWPIVPAVQVVALDQTGHGEWAPAWAVTWLVSMGGALLALPFLLYAGPRHTWGASRLLEPRDAGVMLGGLGAGAAVVALGLLGTGWTLAGVLAFTALLVRGLWRQAPLGSRGAGASALLRSQTLMLLSCFPPMALGLVVDARRVAALELVAGTVLHSAEVAPSGSHVATLVVLDEARHPGPSLSRVAVFDPSGRTPPRLVGERFATVAGWSRDGRYLAVHEHSLGRLWNGAVPLSPGRREYLLTNWIEAWGQRAGATLVLDTRTGHVLSLPPRQVAPGWSDPTDLVHLSVDLTGDWVLEDGRGRRTTLARAQGAPRVQEYRPEGVVLALEAGGACETLLWGAGEPAPWAAPARAAAAWRWSAIQLVPADGPPRLRIARPGDPARVEVPYGVSAEVGADWAVVSEPDGLYRYALPGGERRQLLAGTVVLLRRLSAQRLLVARHGERPVWFELDGASGGLRERPAAPDEWELEWAGPELCLLRGPGGYALQSPDGRLRPLR